MKKFFLSIAAVLALFTATAQRSYVSLYINMNGADSRWVSARVSGDVPASMKDYYAATYDRLTEGELINMLVNEGFNIDRVVGVGDTHSMILMYKNSNDDAGIITMTSNDNDTSVHEVARYNLQGMEVNENCPGIQIIVYSNYTTRTIVVE